MGLMVKAVVHGPDKKAPAGYYGEKLRYDGEQFEIEKVEHFSDGRRKGRPGWMLPVGWDPSTEGKPVPPPKREDVAERQPEPVRSEDAPPPTEPQQPATKPAAGKKGRASGK